MGVNICVLASGSAANCIYIATTKTRILLDVGLSGLETQRRLQKLNVQCEDIHAICLTHEHDDHCNALKVLQNRFQIELYANTGTVDALQRVKKFQELQWNIFTTGESFKIGDIVLDPFSVPHDSFEPVGFIIRHENKRMGVVTDMGMATGLVKEKLRGSHVLIIESNHDLEMLLNSNRPWPLKQRIMGGQGHLSNSQAGDLIKEVADSQLRHVFLAHLSADCNQEKIALDSMKDSISDTGFSNIEVLMTYPNRISELVDL